MNAKDILTGIIFGDDSGGGGGITVSPLPVTENGTYTAPEGEAYSPIEVNVPTSGGEITSGVKFIDYDGTVVETWDASSVASKTALPDNPSHTGLVAQGWNWSLANIKDYIADYPTANVLVGQMYKTSSGLTEIDITVTKVTGLSVTCKMSGNKNWGDGTTDSLTEHTYANYGDYTITCDGTTIPAGTPSYGGMFASYGSNTNGYWCTAIRISENVTSIGEWAFLQCRSLTSITIPDSVTSIGEGTFYICDSLTRVTIPQGVTSIGEETFSSNSLTSIALPQGVTSIEYHAFSSCLFLTSITIPDSVTSIGGAAFADCDSLTRITIPQGVTSIGEGTFYSCESLISIALPQGVTSIGEEAFYYCISLTSITLPQSIESIEDYAFSDCTRLIRYDFTSATYVPMLSDYAFGDSGINGLCKIIVPDALYNDWIVAENWENYADYIYKASEVGA